jgi:HK97 family phage portal protein
LLAKAASPGGYSVSQFQSGRPYYPDISHKSLIEKYIGWVYACANKNAISCAQVPLRLYVAKPSKSAKPRFRTRSLSRKQANYLYSSPSAQRFIRKASDVEEVEEHPFLDLLIKVNDFTNQFDLLEFTFLSQELTGNTYWLLVKSPLGPPTEVWPMLPQFMKIVPDKTKFILRYEYSVDNISKQIIKPEDLVHFRYLSMKTNFSGMGPLEACVAAADLHKEMNAYEVGLMENRAHPDFAIVLPPEATMPGEDAQKRIEKKWLKKFRGTQNTGKPTWLYGGAKLEQLQLSPKELAFLQGRKATLTEICAVYGVPLSKIVTEDVNRANAEAGDYSYMKDTIRPRLRKVEQKMNEKLLPMWDESLFCAFDDPVPEDKEFRLKQTESHLKVGYSSINEERQLDGQDEVGWGNVPILPINVVPLGTAAAVADEDKAIRRQKLHKAPRTLPPLRLPTDAVPESFVEALRGFFKVQQEEILAAFDRDLGGKAVYRKGAEDYMSAWFDMQRWNTELNQITEPFVRRTFMSGGEGALRQLTTARQFDTLNPRVAVALERHRHGNVVGINATTVKRLRTSLAEGLEEGETLTELRGRIEGQYDSFDKHRALVIARTEAIWAWNAGAVEGYIQSGMVQKKQWVSSGDQRTCGFCSDMDGKIIGVEKAFWDKGDVMQINGSKLSFEYDTIEHPPIHPQCRCTVVAVIEGRHHYNRLKKKRGDYWFGREYPMSEKDLGQVANTPHPCSCLGCGNQRRLLGRTMQERRFFSDAS